MSVLSRHKTRSTSFRERSTAPAVGLPLAGIATRTSRRQCGRQVVCGADWRLLNLCEGEVLCGRRSGRGSHNGGSRRFCRFGAAGAGQTGPGLPLRRGVSHRFGACSLHQLQRTALDGPLQRGGATLDSRPRRRRAPSVVSCRVTGWCANLRFGEGFLDKRWVRSLAASAHSDG